MFLFSHQGDLSAECSVIKVFTNIIHISQVTINYYQSQPELTQLMRELLTHHSHRHADPQHYVVREGGANGQAIDEVVQAVTKDHHISHGGHLPIVVVVMAVVTVTIHCFRLVEDEYAVRLRML